MTDIYNSISGCLQRKCRQRERAEWEASATGCCLSFTVPAPSSHQFHQYAFCPAQPADDDDNHPPHFVFLLKSHLMWVPVRSQVCVISTVESLRQTAGVRSRYLDTNRLVCRIMLLKYWSNWTCAYVCGLLPSLKLPWSKGNSTLVLS